jgi:DNA polymerase alpha subunit B
VVNRLTGTLGYLAPTAKMILVPSTSDAMSSYVTVPQPPLHFDLTPTDSQARMRELGLTDSRFCLMPNPAQFTINEIVFAVESVDILMSLGREEVCRGAVGDKWSRVCGHLLGQRSMYPLFPSSDAVSAERGALKMDVKPDVMILPSAMGKFAKEVQGVLVVNPGRLCKNQAGGTFARMSVWPLKVKGAEDVELGHEICPRTRVEIERV